MSPASSDIVVIGAGPAGIVAALRAADLGAKTTLLSRGEFGGMAGNDGPVPVRTLAHAARLLRDAGQQARYGIRSAGTSLDYPALLGRVQEVVGAVGTRSSFRAQLESLGVRVLENAGSARFVDAHTVVTGDGGRHPAGKFIVCTGGRSRKLPIPGFELTATHSDAWGLSAVPESMIVVGAGATGAQVASIFNAFGTRVQLFQAGPRILPTEDADVSAAVAEGFRAAGVAVHEDFGTIERFERAPAGVRMAYRKDGATRTAAAALVVTAVGWVADTEELEPAAAGIALDERGFIRVDEHLRTSAQHVHAAGDAIGRVMLVPQAIQGGFIAATNAVRGPTLAAEPQAAPIGSFTEPEYAQVGLTESRARERHAVVIGRIDFDATTRTIIDGRTEGFCKLVVDAATRRILGCHIVGERAVEIAQLAALAMSGAMTVDALARAPLSYPTYGAVLGRVAAQVAHELGASTVSAGRTAENYMPA
ncbi:MAG TPA: NAD(P)/FAD-dependent oxidoreductase [Steroidobacteraceae bacterium]|nr:NAD(P)/FAD-dependent oxidoreductase [Steroidobacteraceae bacterium]